MFLRKYGTGTGADVIIPIIKRGVVDFAVTADWTPASGDVKVSKDGGTEANIATLPVINGTVGWKFVFSDAELQCKSLTVRVVDSATKAIEDQYFIVETYGHASAMFQSDIAAAQLTANVTHFGGSAGTFGSGLPTVNLAANQDVRNVGGTLPAVILAASQPHYAPAKAGDEMSLTSTVLGSLFSDTDTAALVNAIIARIESDLDGADLSTAAIAVAVRNEILNRVLSGNHETAGTVGKVLQFLDATISGRMAAGNVTVGGYASGQSPADSLAATATKVNSIDALMTALTEVVSTVTRFKAAALSQAPTGSGSGGTGDAEQATSLEIQETVEAIAATLAGASAVEPTGRVAQGGKVTAYIGDDFRDRSDTALPIPVSDPAGGLYTKLTALGANKLRFGVTAPGKAAGLITGTVASITQSGSGASQICTLNVEITNCGSSLPPGDQYLYQIEQEQTHSAETDDFVEIEGKFVLKQRAV